MMPDLWVMRHGETEWNVAGRLQGRSDSALTARGRAQAARQAQLIAAIDASRFSSPQGRARDSARIVFAGQPFATDPRLAEICIGDWTGRSAAELRAEAPDAFTGPRLNWYDQAPGGERFAGLRARVRAFLAELGEPLRGVGLQLGELLAADEPVLELLGCGRQVDAQLLGRGGGLHGLGAGLRGHPAILAAPGRR